LVTSDRSTKTIFYLMENEMLLEIMILQVLINKLQKGSRKVPEKNLLN
jgi:hypothetical protein